MRGSPWGLGLQGFLFCSEMGFPEQNHLRKCIRKTIQQKGKKKHLPQGHFPKTGAFHARSGARTLDTLIKSQVLYQLS